MNGVQGGYPTEARSRVRPALQKVGVIDDGRGVCTTEPLHESGACDNVSNERQYRDHEEGTAESMAEAAVDGSEGVVWQVRRMPATGVSEIKCAATRAWGDGITPARRMRYRVGEQRRAEGCARSPPGWPSWLGCGESVLRSRMHVAVT